MCFYFTCFFKKNLHFSTFLSSVTAFVLFLFFHIPEMFIFARDECMDILEWIKVQYNNFYKYGTAMLIFMYDCRMSAASVSDLRCCTVTLTSILLL